jgi:tRNA pseudouridine55 synthase
MDGILNFNKPAGITSAAAVGRVKRFLPRGTRIGHAGTLDPFATGVLLLLVGKATKSCEALMGQTKTYVCTVCLGATTETDDLESPEVAFAKSEIPPKHEDIQNALGQFVGLIEQTPPQFSAIKIRGKRACDRIRSGEMVTLQARTVRVDFIEILNYSWPLLELEIVCGRGTYIRAIARDLGNFLNVGGYLRELRRTRIGKFAIEDSVTFEQLDNSPIENWLQAI